MRSEQQHEWLVALDLTNINCVPPASRILRFSSPHAGDLHASLRRVSAIVQPVLLALPVFYWTKK